MGHRLRRLSPVLGAARVCVSGGGMENADSGAGDTALSQRRERPARRRVRSRDLRATAVDGAPALRPARWSFAGRLAAAEWSDWPSVNRADDDDDEATVPEAPLPNRVRSVSSGSADGGSRLDWRDGSWAPREPRRSKRGRLTWRRGV
eukprot:ctg_7054.g598